MAKKVKKISPPGTSPSPLSEEELGLWTQRALSLATGEGDLEAFLAEMESLSPQAASQVAQAIAQQGDERGLPLLARLAKGEKKDLALAGVEALGKIRSQAAAGHLLEVAEGSPPKEILKAARRALHHLQSRGFRAEAASARRSLEPAPARRQEPRAWASAVDGVGSRLVYLALPRPLGGTAIFLFMVNDEDGMRKCQVLQVPDEDARARVEEFARGSGLTTVSIPFDYGRYLVREGAERSRTSGRRLPTDYLVWRELIGEPESRWETPPVYQEISALTVKGDPSLLGQSPKLLELREFWSWYLPDKVMGEARELEKAKASSLVLSPEAQGERQERILSKAVEGLFPPPRRALCRRRLEEMSHVLLHSGREREARWSLAAALALEDEGPRGSPIYLPGSPQPSLSLGEAPTAARHPFLRRLVLESLEMALGELSRGSKLLVTS